MGIRTSSFLLVGLGNRGAIGSPVDFPTLTGVELEGLPGLPIVHTLVDSNRIGFRCMRAEDKINIGDFVFLPEA